jgi:fucose 4-O-acetylase-like acetyltransferase
MDFAEMLEPLAAQFRDLNMPEVVVHWGHPAMMGIVIFAMGTFAGITGWKGRLATDNDVKLAQLADHKKVAPLMALFLAMGYTGGVISLVVQEQSIFESPHFWTGSIVLLLLLSQGLLTLAGFWGDKAKIRTAHAHLGSVTLGVMVLHAVFGLTLGLSI